MRVYVSDRTRGGDLVAFLRRHGHAAYWHDGGASVSAPVPPLPSEVFRIERAVEDWSRLNSPCRAFIERAHSVPAERR